MTVIISGTDGVSDVDGTAGTPALRGTDANTGIFFPAADTIAFAEGGAEAMRIDSNGNVGIGTSSPTGNLDVKTATDSKLVFKDGTTTGTVQVTAVNLAFTAYRPLELVADVIQLYTAGVERARITSAGELLVGTTSVLASGSKLQLLGASGFSAGVIKVSTNGDGAFIFRNTSDLTVGNIQINVSSTVYSTSSDYRLKENIAPMTGALATVTQLKPCTYTWKVDGSAGQGFIAHELQAVVPDCVTGEKDAFETYTDAEGNEQTRPVHQGVDTSFLVATLTAAIQELSAKNDALEARIAALEAQ